MTKSTKRPTEPAFTADLLGIFSNDYQRERVFRAFDAVNNAAVSAWTRADIAGLSREEALSVSNAVKDLFVLELEAVAAKAAGYASWSALETAEANDALET